MNPRQRRRAFQRDSPVANADNNIVAVLESGIITVAAVNYERRSTVKARDIIVAVARVVDYYFFVAISNSVEINEIVTLAADKSGIVAVIRKGIVAVSAEKCCTVRNIVVNVIVTFAAV